MTIGELIYSPAFGYGIITSIRDEIEGRMYTVTWDSNTIIKTAFESDVLMWKKYLELLLDKQNGEFL